jgi:hypothetical protein
MLLLDMQEAVTWIAMAIQQALCRLAKTSTRVVVRSWHLPSVEETVKVTSFKRTFVCKRSFCSLSANLHISSVPQEASAQHTDSNSVSFAGILPVK